MVQQQVRDTVVQVATFLGPGDCGKTGTCQGEQPLVQGGTQGVDNLQVRALAGDTTVE